MVSSLIVVEWAEADVSLEGPREILLIVQGHHEALVVEQLIQTALLEVQHLADEPVHNVANLRMVWLVGENGHICHQFVPDRTCYIVNVDSPRFSSSAVPCQTPAKTSKNSFKK